MQTSILRLPLCWAGKALEGKRGTENQLFFTAPNSQTGATSQAELTSYAHIFLFCSLPLPAAAHSRAHPGGRI